MARTLIVPFVMDNLFPYRARVLPFFALGAAALFACGSGGSDSGGGGEGGGAGAEEGGGGAPDQGGCADNSECDADSYCATLGYGCGDVDFGGACQPRPDAVTCNAADQDVCGCDGTIYDSVCHAAAVGVDAALYSNSCEAPADTFECGYTFCQRETEACVEEFEVSFNCQEIPETCDEPDPEAGAGCECFTSGSCSCSNGEGGGSAAGNVRVTCGV